MKLGHRLLLTCAVTTGAFLLVIHSHVGIAHAASDPNQVVITDGGSEGPVFMTDFPTTGSSNRTTTLMYTVGSALSGCIRPAISVPSGEGISISSDQSGGGATNLPLPTGTVVTETLTVTLSSTSVLQDMAGVTIFATCGSTYTNSIPVLIGRTPGMLLTVNNSSNDFIDSVTVPTTGTITRSYVVGYERQGIATGCIRYAINPAAFSNGTGITANLSTDETVDAVSQELLTLTFAPGALLTPFTLPITATCIVNGNNITPIYRRLIQLYNGIPLSIAMVNPDGSFTSGSTTVTIPATGTYTGTFPLRYAEGTGALGCNRLAIPPPPAGVTVSSTDLTDDTVMLQPRDITNVTEEDVTVSISSPNTPFSYSLPVTIECSNTIPQYQTFNINIVRQQADPTTSITFRYNGDVSTNGSLSDTDLLNLPLTGATSRTLQVDWTVPVGSTGCMLYREDIDTLSGRSNLGNGPGVTPPTYQGSDPYSYPGKSITASGVDQNFILDFSSTDLAPGKAFTMQYAVWCASGQYAHTDIVVARITDLPNVTTACITGYDPVPTPNPTNTPTSPPTSPTTPASPTLTSSGVGGGLGDVVPPGNPRGIYTFDEVFNGSAGFAGQGGGGGSATASPVPSPGTSPISYTPPVSPIYSPTINPLPTPPVIISTTPCGTGTGGGGTPPTPTPTPTTTAGGPTSTPTSSDNAGDWNYGVSSKSL